MEESDPGSYTRRGLLRVGAGAATAGAVTAVTGTAGAQADAYGEHFDNTDNFDGTTADATAMDEVRILVGGEGNAQNQAFRPAAVAIEPGTTVVWEWTGNGGPHNVIHRPGPDPAREEELFNSQSAHEGFATAEQGTTFEYTFEESGSFLPYVCSPHATLGMKGAVVVGAENAPTDLVEYSLGGGEAPTGPIWGGAIAFGLVSFLGLAAYRTLVSGAGGEE